MARRPRGRIISVFQDFANIYVYNYRENYITSMIVFFFRLQIPLTHPRTDGTAPRRHRDGRRFEKIYLCKYEECIYLNPNPPFPAPESVISLPPLDCLRFFEATARHESFALAADELGVSAAAVSRRRQPPPSATAVSHRIRTLEQHLDADLFERRRRSVRPCATRGRRPPRARAPHRASSRRARRRRRARSRPPRRGGFPARTRPRAQAPAHRAPTTAAPPARGRPPSRRHTEREPAPGGAGVDAHRAARAPLAVVRVLVGDEPPHLRVHREPARRRAVANASAELDAGAGLRVAPVLAQPHLARALVVFPQDAYPDSSAPHDYIRAVLEANPSRPRRRRGLFVAPGAFALYCLLGHAYTSQYASV